MPEIQIRPISPSDIQQLVELEHNYETDYAWQMELQSSRDKNHFASTFRKVRLPRTQRVEYPHRPNSLLQNWTERSGLLVALLNGRAVGYMSANLRISPSTSWVTDLVVDRRLRRRGIGTALLLAAQDWSSEQDSLKMVLEMQLKNFPGINMAHKYGFEFCGYNDKHFNNRDTALFFTRLLK